MRLGIQLRTKPRLQIPTEFLDVSKVQFILGGLANKVNEWQKKNNKFRS